VGSNLAKDKFILLLPNSLGMNMKGFRNPSSKWRGNVKLSCLVMGRNPPGGARGLTLFCYFGEFFLYVDVYVRLWFGCLIDSCYDINSYGGTIINNGEGNMRGHVKNR